MKIFKKITILMSNISKNISQDKTPDFGIDVSLIV